MKQANENDILFSIRKEELQYEAKEKIGRELTDEEILIARKGLEWGLRTGIGTIYHTIFNEMIKP